MKIIGELHTKYLETKDELERSIMVMEDQLNRTKRELKQISPGTLAM